MLVMRACWVQRHICCAGLWIRRHDAPSLLAISSTRNGLACLALSACCKLITKLDVAHLLPRAILPP